MPLSLLAALANSALPAQVQGEDIEKLEVLHAAGLVVAQVPVCDFIDGAYRYRGEASVTAVTNRGVSALGRATPPQAAGTASNRSSP